jgi:hypothetical protein
LLDKKIPVEGLAVTAAANRGMKWEVRQSVFSMGDCVATQQLCRIIDFVCFCFCLRPGDEYDRRLGAKSFGAAGGSSSSGEDASDDEGESDDPLDIDSDDMVAGVEYAGVCGVPTRGGLLNEGEGR